MVKKNLTVSLSNIQERIGNNVSNMSNSFLSSKLVYNKQSSDMVDKRHQWSTYLTMRI